MDPEESDSCGAAKGSNSAIRATGWNGRSKVNKLWD